METNSDRLDHFRRYSAPTPDMPWFKDVMEQLQARKNDPKTTKEYDKRWIKARNTVNTQTRNGISSLMDQELRFFLSEFNKRTWAHGLGAMPAAFSILEAFFIWDAKNFFFELAEEEEHLFAVPDFLSYLSSDNSKKSYDYFLEFVDDEVIYTYNVINEVDEITFKTSDSREFVLGGISFIKRGDEVTILLIGGEVLPDEDIQEDFLIDLKEAGILHGRGFITPSEDRELEIVKLFDRHDIWKINIYVRVNLETEVIEAKYIQKDVGDRYVTYTDDLQIFPQKRIDSGSFPDLMADQMEELEKYATVFQMAYNCLYLPEFFDFNEENITFETFPTELDGEKSKKPIHRKKLGFSNSHFLREREVNVLDLDLDIRGVKLEFDPTTFYHEKEGYWKKLSPGELGVDKVGNTIHNRTWVKKELSWYQGTRSSAVEVEIDQTRKVNRDYFMLNSAEVLDVELEKIKILAEKFKSYRVTNQMSSLRIVSWLLQFPTIPLLEIGLRMVENIAFYSEEEIIDSIQRAYSEISQFLSTNSIYVPLGGPQDSSSTICYSFFKRQFSNEAEGGASIVELSNLAEQLESNSDSSIVFIDDNITSGTQLFQFFEEIFGEPEKRELIFEPFTDEQKAILAKKDIFVCYAIRLHENSYAKVEQIKAQFGINLRVVSGLTNFDNYLTPPNPVFVNAEVLKYSNLFFQDVAKSLYADKGWELKKIEDRSCGYGNYGKLIVFAHNIPKSLYPVMWKFGIYNRQYWVPLFPEASENEKIKGAAADFPRHIKTAAYRILKTMQL